MSDKEIYTTHIIFLHSVTLVEKTPIANIAQRFTYQKQIYNFTSTSNIQSISKARAYEQKH